MFKLITICHSELRRRLRAKGLPAPSQRGTETAHRFPFSANIAARIDPAAHIIEPRIDGDGGRETILENPEPATTSDRGRPVS